MKENYNGTKKTSIQSIESLKLSIIEKSIILIYVVLFFLQIVSDMSYEMRITVGTFQSLISLYLVFRFLIPGLIGALFVHISGLVPLVYIYIIHKDILILAVIRLLVGTIIGLIIITKLALNNRLQQKQLKELAMTDKLTGLFNHHYLQIKLDQIILNTKEAGVTFGLVLLDVDNFKILNDTYGYSFGDRILCEIAQFLRSEIGKEGSIYRYGGDKFAIIFTPAKLEIIESIVINLRKNFSKLNFQSDAQEPLRLTFSTGFSIYPDLAQTKDELFSQADTALYHAKNQGKDSSSLYHNVFAYLENHLPESDIEFTAGCKAILATLSIKDKYTIGHSERVQNYVDRFAEALGLDSSFRRTLNFAALLHDIGKIEIPQSILNKKEQLTEEEFEQIKKHPLYGVQILEPLGHIENLGDIVKYHHERFDGQGYPEGLKGEQIPLGARILCIADSFDAMLSIRPYTRNKTLDESLAELERCAGSQFDPKLAPRFIEAIRLGEPEIGLERKVN
jgi:diguanylate cyclase (GGDEF)-like protein/putative nucleotidyltransferase with HDIG domain